MSKKVIDRDTTIKVLSVLFAILLWFYVITEQNPVVPKDITVPVKITNIEALDKNNLIMLEDPNSFFISLKLKGKKELLDTININNINAFADVSRYLSEGENEIPVVVSNIPDGVSINTKSYQTIKVTLDKKIASQRTVVPYITGNPVAGLANMKPELAPTEIVLTGPESIVNTIKEVRVDVDIAGAGADVIKRLPVRLLDEKGNEVTGIKTDAQWINVTIPIANTKRVPIQLILEGGAAEGYTIANQSVQPREILVTGDQQVLDGLSSINTNAVKLDNVTQDTELAVTLNLPEGVHLVNSNEQVKATLDIQKIITSNIEINTIGYRNLDPRFAFGRELSGNITVTVRGPEDLVNNAAQNTELYVDLRNAKEGEDSYEILWDTTSKLEILEVSPQRISVDIAKRE